MILPDCAVLTPAQARLLRDLLAAGTRLLVLGDLGTNLPPEVLAPILDHPGVRRVPIVPGMAVDDLLDEPQVRVTPGGDLMINLQRVEGGAAVHVIRYDFDADQDRTPPLPELTIELRLPEQFNRLSVHSPSGEMTGALECDGLVHRLRLRDVPISPFALVIDACTNDFRVMRSPRPGERNNGQDTPRGRGRLDAWPLPLNL